MVLEGLGIGTTPEPMGASTSVDGPYESSRRAPGASNGVYKSMFLSIKGSAVLIHAIFIQFCVIVFWPSERPHYFVEEEYDSRLGYYGTFLPSTGSLLVLFIQF